MIKDHPLLIDGAVPRLQDLNAFPNPITLLLVWNVDILDPDCATWDAYEMNAQQNQLTILTIDSLTA